MDGNDVVTAVVIGVAIFGIGLIASSSYFDSQIRVTGTIFCEGYNLTYSTWEYNTEHGDGFHFVCLNQTLVQKVDTIGVLGSIGVRK